MVLIWSPWPPPACKIAVLTRGRDDIQQNNLRFMLTVNTVAYHLYTADHEDMEDQKESGGNEA